MSSRRKSSTNQPIVPVQAKSQPVADELGSTRVVPNKVSASTSTTAPPSTSSVRPSPGSPSNTSPVPTDRNPFESINNTPVKLGSAHRSGPTTPSASTATHAQTRQSEPATPAPMTQAQLDINIESEMHNAIFHDPDFVEHFLTGDSTTLDAVLAGCRQGEAYSADDEQWRLPSHISSEAVLYPPVLNVLNVIKRSVDWVKAHPPSDDLSSSQTDQAFHPFSDNDPDNVPLEPGFLDRHSRAVDSDEVETAGLKPDIVLFNTNEVEHWETVRMAIEIKKLPTHHKAAMKQLSRYARATFAHQLHRRHLFGLTICGTEATFVLFDRAGILYSPRINMKSEFEEFTKAFASLLLLNRTDEGYDTAFEVELNENRRLKYYVHLPTCAFKPPTAPGAGPSRAPNPRHARQTRKFEVIDRLCHRKSIRGRATIVLRLRELRDSEKPNKRGVPVKAEGNRKMDETKEPQTGDSQAQEKASATRKRKREETEEPQARDYVLKIIWRDPARDSEGEVMEQFRGMFGLPQHVWHADAPGRCRCSPPVDGQCWAPSCVAATAQWERMEVCDNLQDIKIPVPMDDEDAKEKDYIQVDTTQHRSTTSIRKRRICSYILMSSIGVRLAEASSPSEFMNAVLDAILGYWRLFNMGVLHRDISDGNVMMLHMGHSESTSASEDELERQKLPEEPWRAALSAHEPALAESEDMLQTILAQLSRNPTGMLSDFDLHAKHALLSPWSTIHSTQDRIPDRCISSPSKAASATPPPESKRRRTNLRQSLPVSSRPSQSTSRASTARPEPSSHAQGFPEGKIDFRTGTPAFMSIRVLEVTVGTPYHHSYLDDLESFFWVIVWSVAAHLDKDSYCPTNSAQATLDAMNQADFDILSGWKKGELNRCRGRSGGNMRKRLNSYNNAWAKDPALTNIIIRLGQYLEKFDCGDLPASASPATVFPVIVNIILEELSR